VLRLPLLNVRGFARRLVAVLAFGLAIGACDRGPARSASALGRVAALRAEVLPAPYSRLVPVADTLEAPQLGDWLSVHDEPGQSLAEYLAAPRPSPAPGRTTLVLMPLGTPSTVQLRVLARTGRYLAASYGLPVRFEPPVPLAAIPAEARRTEHGFGPQVNTRWVLDSLLVARRAPDARFEVALSAFDLYPDASWNFVFGQALPAQGVGVWSMARYGDAEASPAAESMVLARTLRTSSHEIGHLLGLAHCTTWRCLMNGSNSLPELDRRPLSLCPGCTAKVCSALGLDPAARARALARELDADGLTADSRREEALANALANRQP
jgi:archaemetzincin